MASEYRLVVCGCRDFSDYKLLSKEIDSFLKNIVNNHSVTIVSGGANGADKLGERYAHEHGFEVELHPALWEQFGKAESAIAHESQSKKRFEYNARLKAYKAEKDNLLKGEIL